MRVNNSLNNLPQVGGSPTTSALRSCINNLRRHNTSIKDDGRGGRRRNSGWSWAVIIGTSLITALVPSLVICGGVIVRECKLMFGNVNYTQLSLVLALMFSLWNFLGPVTPVLLGALSSRTITLTGGILLFLSISLSSQSYNINIFYFIFSILGGIGGGLLLNPGAILINRHFGKDKILASGICLFLGSTLQIFVPFVMTYLMTSFNPSGFFLLLGAILLNVSISAFLFPNNETGDKKTIPTSRNLIDVRHMLALNPTGHGTTCKIKRQCKRRNTKPKNRNSQQNLTLLQVQNEILVSPAVLRLTRQRTHSTCSRNTLPDIPEEQEPGENEEGENTSLTYNSNINVANVGNKDQQNCSSGRTGSGKRGRVRTISNSSTTTKTSTNNNVKNINNISVRCRFSSWFYVITVVANSIHTLLYPNVLLYATTRAYDLKCTQYQVAFLLSVYIMTDMLARFLISWFLPKGYFRPQRIFMISAFLEAASVWGFSYFPIYSCYCIGFGVYGLANGACAVIMSSIIFEYVGVRQFSSRLSFSQVIQGLTFLFITPFFGVIVDTTSQINHIFYLIISLHLFTLLLWFVEPFMHTKLPPPTRKRSTQRLQKVIVRKS